MQNKLTYLSLLEKRRLFWFFIFFFFFFVAFFLVLCPQLLSSVAKHCKTEAKTNTRCINILLFIYYFRI